MGADFNIKPVGAPVAAPIIRPEPEAARAAVPTQLPPDKAVTATDALPHPALSPANYQQADADRISRRVVIDQAAAEVVYVSVDKKTNQIINQFPEESRLRTRAYLRALDTVRIDRRLETDRKA
ncbi:hypothetical protein [Rhodopseudomonas sp. P2A-2r]|uniref:hypothetical protein n=1 Tax=unclassified Rhodopseudomonas TaxID=2638247 RepID=UPI002234E66B|nr:hypothetical protein [Rhodopseudomonas sp. P2A-2r]UZE51314.1 hypothetical protein ONR75_12285 [Rhodopseudomonas sp. P2A-2r]